MANTAVALPGGLGPVHVLRAGTARAPGCELMNLEAINWDSLERLRAAFLAGTAGASDYWQSEADLASYDATFAQRIGWKWDYVLMELQRRGWSPPGGELLDWGCGSGIASRAFLDLF